MLSVENTNLIGIYLENNPNPTRKGVIEEMEKSYIFTEDKNMKKTIAYTMDILKGMSDEVFEVLIENIVVEDEVSDEDDINSREWYF